MIEKYTDQELEAQPYSRVLKNYWATNDFYEQYYMGRDPYVVSCAHDLKEMQADPDDADINQILVEGLNDYRYGYLKNQKPLTGSGLWSFVLRDINYLGMIRETMQRHNLSQSGLEGADYEAALKKIDAIKYPSPAFAQPGGYKDLIRWVVTDLHAREIFLWQFSIRTVQTTWENRGFDLALFYHSMPDRLNGQSTWLDIGSSDMSIMLGLAENKQFEPVLFKLSEKDGPKEADRNAEISRLLNEVANRPVDFAKVYCVDRSVPISPSDFTLDKGTLGWIRACRLPKEIENYGDSRPEEYAERIRLQKHKLIPYWGELTVRGIENMLPTEQPDIPRGEADMVDAKTFGGYVPKKLARVLIKLAEAYATNNGVAVISENMSVQRNKLDYNGNRWEPWSYLTVLLGRKGKITAKPEVAFRYKDSRCREAIIEKDFLAMPLAKELGL